MHSDVGSLLARQTASSSWRRAGRIPRWPHVAAFPRRSPILSGPTSALFAAAIGIYILFHCRKYFLEWILAALAAVVPFLTYNVLVYGRVLQPYFTQQVFLPLAPSSISRLIVALAGQCISPSRGLFVFSPFLLFSVYGAVAAIRRRWETPLTYYLIAALLAHWLVISAFLDWTPVTLMAHDISRMCCRSLCFF